jgi:hypothetical protein
LILVIFPVIVNLPSALAVAESPPFSSRTITPAIGVTPVVSVTFPLIEIVIGCAIQSDTIIIPADNSLMRFIEDPSC